MAEIISHNVVSRGLDHGCHYFQVDIFSLLNRKILLLNKAKTLFRNSGIYDNFSLVLPFGVKEANLKVDIKKVSSFYKSVCVTGEAVWMKSYIGGSKYHMTCVLISFL